MCTQYFHPEENPVLPTALTLASLNLTLSDDQNYSPNTGRNHYYTCKFFIPWCRTGGEIYLTITVPSFL